MEQTNLNLIPQKEKPIVNASQYDNGRVVRFNLFNGEDEYTLSGTETAVCNIRKVDGHVVVITPAISAVKYIDVTLTEQANACFGDQIGELVITSGDVVIGTCNFILRVEKSPMTGGITSASDFVNLTTQIEDIVYDTLGDDYYNKTEIDALIADIPTFDPTNYYDKSDVNTLLSTKADSSSVYTKSEVDNALGLKANAADVYTKGETDTLLSAKADTSDVYTKTEVDNKINYLYPLKADYIPFFEGLKNGTHNYVALGSLTWNYYQNGIFFQSVAGKKNGGQNLSCNVYKTSSVLSWFSIEDKAVVGNVANAYVYVRDTDYSDPTVFKNAMTAANAYIIYELDTPITPTITQAQLETLIKAFNNNMVNVILKV